MVSRENMPGHNEGPRERDERSKSASESRPKGRRAALLQPSISASSDNPQLSLISRLICQICDAGLGTGRTLRYRRSTLSKLVE